MHKEDIDMWDKHIDMSVEEHFLFPLETIEAIKSWRNCEVARLQTNELTHFFQATTTYFLFGISTSLSVCLYSRLCQEKFISLHCPVIIHVVPIIHRSHLYLHFVHLHRACLASSDPLQSFFITIVLLVRVIFREGYISSQFWHHLLFCHSIRQEVYYPPIQTSVNNVSPSPIPTNIT